MDITNSFYSNFSKYNIPVIKNGVRLPQVNITPEERQKAGVKPDAGNYEYLKKITWNGCKEKAKEGLTGAIKDQIVARLKNEFEVLEKTGTTDYILLLNDIVKQFKGNNIQMGCSRGSAGGAYSLYALDIIGLDGIKYDLLFSRFLNESRAKCQIIDGVKHVDGSTMCDVDIDVEQARRPEAVKLIEDRYPGKTAHISTVQYLTSKTALKNTLKAYLEYSESDSKAITDCIEIVFGKVDSLEKTYEKNKTFQQWADKPENKRALEIAKKLSGLYNTFGCHASGILVSYYDLNDIMPMELSSSGEIVSGYSMEYALSFVAKIDILGISTLNTINFAAEAANVKTSEIDVNDPAIYEFLAKEKDYYGLFQISDGATKHASLEIKPRNIQHIAAILSISRPGAIKYISDFAKFVNKGEFKEIYPPIDNIIKETGMIIIYQEQISKILQEVYGFTGVDADNMRRIIGKKKREELESIKPKIFAQGLKNNVPDAVTNWFWDTCNASADYLFNKCLHPDTLVCVEGACGGVPIRNVKGGHWVLGYNPETKKREYYKVLDTVLGREKMYEFGMNFRDASIKCSENHKMLCTDGKMRRAIDILNTEYEVVSFYGNVKLITKDFIGEVDSYDLHVDSPNHNFYADGFVVSNSHAYGYAYITAYTAYLKSKHPREFFLGCLKTVQFEQDPMTCISEIFSEMKHFNIPLYPPSLVKSKNDYSIENDGIRMGLCSIKGLREKGLEKLSNFRKDYSNKFEMFQFLEQSGVGISIISPLILSGCLGIDGESRNKLLMELEIYRELTEKEKPIVHNLGSKYNYDIVAIVKAMSSELKNDKGKPLIKESRLKTLRKDLKKSFERYNHNERFPELTYWVMEKTFIGFPYSTSLKSIYSPNVDSLLTIKEIAALPKLSAAPDDENHDQKAPDQNVKFVAYISEVEERVARESKKSYFKLVLKDELGTINGLLFGDKRAMVIFNKNGIKQFEEDMIVIVHAIKKDENTVFINDITVQDNPVVVKKSQLKDKEI